MLERRGRATERRDDGEAAGDDPGHVHRGLGDPEHRPARDAARGVDPGIVEAGDDVAVEPRRLTLAHLVEQARDGERLVVVAFDAGRPHDRGGRRDLGAEVRDGTRSRVDLCRHRARGVRVDDENAHATRSPTWLRASSLARTDGATGTWQPDRPATDWS
jgi:hypothetical protein